MIRVTTKTIFTNTAKDNQIVGQYQQEIFLNSTDDKPTDTVVNGSVCCEVDTGDIYLFDEENTTWTKMFTLKESE